MTFEDGTRVKIDGLKSRPDLNGEAGLVVHFDEESGRYVVVLLAKKHESEHVRLKAENLSSLTKDSKAKASSKPAAAASLLKRKSQADGESPSCPPGTNGDSSRPMKKVKTAEPLHPDIKAVVERIADAGLLKRFVDSCNLCPGLVLSVEKLTAVDIKQGLTWLRAAEAELQKLNPSGENLKALSQSFMKALGHMLPLGSSKQIICGLEDVKSKSQTLEILSDIENSHPKLLRVAAGGGKKKVESSDSEDEQDEFVEPSAKSKRPITPFFRYITEHRESVLQKLRNETPEAAVKPTEVVKRASEIWKAMSDEERAPYEDPWKAEKAAYDQERAERKAREEAEAWEADPLDQRKYRMLSCSLSPISRGSPVWSLVAENVLGTQQQVTPADDYFVSIERVFGLNRPGEEKAWLKSSHNTNRRLLWYGAPEAALANLLSDGMRLPRQETPFSGYGFGKGIYFSDMVSAGAKASLSAGLSDGARAVLLLCEVALGKSMERHQVDAKSSAKLPPGYSSTVAIGKLGPSGSRVLPDGARLPLGPVREQPAPMVAGPGQRLPYNQYVVYNTGHIRMRYLLEVKLISGSSQDAISQARTEAQSLTAAAEVPLTTKRLCKKTASDQTLLSR